MIHREKSIELLNRAVAEELTAVHQYMYFHFHCEDMGYDLLASLFHRTAIKEMQHVEQLAERILFLKGEVEMKWSAGVEKITDPDKMLLKSDDLENISIEHYNKWAKECATNEDAVSKKVFEDILADEEKHLDQFETEKDNLEKFSSSYLALQSIEHSKSIIAGKES